LLSSAGYDANGIARTSHAVAIRFTKVTRGVSSCAVQPDGTEWRRRSFTAVFLPKRQGEQVRPFRRFLLAFFLRGSRVPSVEMRVRIKLQPRRETVDGVSLARFKPGLVYAVPTSIATLMIVEGWAEPVGDQTDCTLPEIIFHVLRPHERRHRTLSPGRLSRELGIAADRRRRN
jgi:hypothetical protein